jgi:hypothetical protein
VRTVYPERAGAVAAWLANLPGGAKDGPKEHAWSHMAGFYAENGCEGFCRLVWDDSKIATQLEQRLTMAGAWRTLEAAALSPACRYLHTPFWQLVPVAQALPQAPQLAASEPRFTQVPPQSALPGAHEEQQRKPVSAYENVA